MSPAALLVALTERIMDRHVTGILRVGIDGVDGAGKTTLADRLAQVLKAQGKKVIRASVDGFHNPRAVRYARGKESPEGFYRDSYDYAALRVLLLDPLSNGGSGRYRRAAYDHRSDGPVNAPIEVASPMSVLLVDGIFLHRPDLLPYWDLSVFLDVSFENSCRRQAVRDGADPDPLALSNRRYVEGQKLYLSEAEPRSKARIVVDYNDLENPRIVRG